MKVAFYDRATREVISVNDVADTLEAIAMYQPLGGDYWFAEVGAGIVVGQALPLNIDPPDVITPAEL